eukprot:904818-Prymnesium_polylepis.1
MKAVSFSDSSLPRVRPEVAAGQPQAIRNFASAADAHACGLYRSAGCPSIGYGRGGYSTHCEYIMGNGRYMHVGQRSNRMRAPGVSQPSGRVGAHHKRRPRV